MRAGLSTIQQTLTPEAAAVLNRSIEEAARRGHGQTTPLHVAATLLASPSGLLRQACVRSHPTTSHPLQCRALELCFSVALDRLPTNNNNNNNNNTSNNSSAPSMGSVAEPPISNALMAALKRAQAHQRRGCPEQQQQPLLAVKVELEQLVVSILDDPGVSRVMREASFSSPAVKATIEQSISSPSSTTTTTSTTCPTSATPSATLGLNYRGSARNLYINPRLQQQQQPPSAGGSTNSNSISGDPQRKDDVKKVLDILARSKKRNPVLVGDSDPDAVMREVLRSIGTADAPPILRTARVINAAKELASVDRTQIPTKIKELSDAIEAAGGLGGVVIDLGDLKWLVESPVGVGGLAEMAPVQQQQQIISETGRAAVAEMGRLLTRFGSGNGGGRVWLVGTATCATYLRCQVYHPAMENDWDVQAMPIAPRGPLPGLFPRLGVNGILSSSIESLSPAKVLPAMGTTTIPLRRPAEGVDLARRTALCTPCKESYERELAKLVANEFEKSSSRAEPRQALPQWLQIAPPSSASPTTNQAQSKEQELEWKQSTEELLKKWRETCARIHPNFHSSALSMPASYNPLLLPRQPLPPSLTLSQSITPLQLNNHQGAALSSLERPASPPGSPVTTDLVLGNPKISDTHKERVKNFSAGCMQDKQGDKIAGILDVDSFKRLFTGLTERVAWQPEAASAVATVVIQCKSGNGKRRGSTPKGDTWLLFMGPDSVGKKKMAVALSELVCGTGPITVNLGRPQTDSVDGDPDLSSRGKTSVDKVADAIRQNPFSVIVLEHFDQADVLVRGTIKRAMERGRLPDSYGREVSLGSVIFVLTADSLPDDLKCSQESLLQSEEKILEAANSGWHLELSVRERTAKRRSEWQCDDEPPAKPRREPCGAGLSLDLNLAVGVDDDAGEGSRNSSDVTIEHEHEHERLAVSRPPSSLSLELINSVDSAIVFKPVDFGPLRQRVSESISAKFAAVMGNVRPLHVDDNALDKMVAGAWLSGPTAKFDEWAEKVLVPSIYQLKCNLKTDDHIVVRLSLVKGSKHTPRNGVGDLLPRTVTIAVDGLAP